MLEKLNFIKQTASTCIRLMAPTSHFVGRRGLFLTAKIINNDDKIIKEYDNNVKLLNNKINKLTTQRNVIGLGGIISILALIIFIK